MVRPGNPSTPADEADVEITVSVTDVHNRSGLSDYQGELRAISSLRITDRGGGVLQTVTDQQFSWTVPCTSTPTTTVGSACTVTTSADAIVPGSVSEGLRTIWQMGQVQVQDGGEDGVASTVNDNTLFMKQGIFVP